MKRTALKPRPHKLLHLPDKDHFQEDLRQRYLLRLSRAQRNCSGAMLSLHYRINFHCIIPVLFYEVFKELRDGAGRSPDIWRYHGRSSHDHPHRSRYAFCARPSEAGVHCRWCHGVCFYAEPIGGSCSSVPDINSSSQPTQRLLTVFFTEDIRR